MRIIDEALLLIVKNNPDGSEKEHFDSAKEELRAGNYFEDLLSYWFRNRYPTIRQDHNATYFEKQKRRAAAQRRAKKFAVAKLMDFVLPNGKLLRFSTFAACASVGGWLSDVSKHGKPNEIVGRKLTETDLINIQRRNSRKAA